VLLVLSWPPPPLALVMLLFPACWLSSFDRWWVNLSVLGIDLKQRWLNVALPEGITECCHYFYVMNNLLVTPVGK
jgi:hypothetical protein